MSRRVRIPDDQLGTLPAGLTVKSVTEYTFPSQLEYPLHVYRSPHRVLHCQLATPSRRADNLNHVRDWERISRCAVTNTPYHIRINRLTF